MAFTKAFNMTLIDVTGIGGNAVTSINVILNAPLLSGKEDIVAHLIQEVMCFH